MYTREQLDALKSTLRTFADAAEVEAGSRFDCDEVAYHEGKRDAYLAAASHDLALIESEEEVPA